MVTGSPSTVIASDQRERGNPGLFAHGAGLLRRLRLLVMTVGNGLARTDRAGFPADPGITGTAPTRHYSTVQVLPECSRASRSPCTGPGAGRPEASAIPASCRASQGSSRGLA